MTDTASVSIGGTRVAWRLFDVDATEPPNLEVLSRTERARADRLRTPLLRQRCRARRALLRGILAAESGIPAGDVRLTTGPHGKPRLDGRGDGSLQFNTSHRGRWLLVGWIREPIAGVELGVDLEPRCSLSEGIVLAERWLRQEERLRAIELGVDFADAGFPRIWTRKEAVMKAAGLGLSLDPRSFVVPGEPAVPAAVDVSVPSEPGRCFQLLDLGSPDWPVDLLGSVCIARTS